MEDHCVMCGEIIPEGRQVCPMCEKKYGGSDELLIKLDEAAVHDPEPAHLKNDIPQQSLPESKITLTVSEAAEMIGISKPSMYEVVRAGKVRSVKVGKKILISRQSLMDWLQE